MLLADEDFSELQLESVPANPPDLAMVEQPVQPIALNDISVTKRSQGRAMRLKDSIHHTQIQVFIDSRID